MLILAYVAIIAIIIAIFVCLFCCCKTKRENTNKTYIMMKDNPDNTILPV